MSKRDFKPMTIRMPRAAAEFLERIADENFTSCNAEVVRCVLDRMKAVGPVGSAIPPGLRSTNPRQETSDERVAG